MKTEDKIKKIIDDSVKKAAHSGIDRRDIARSAAILADKKGVNVQVNPWRQTVFYNALDRHCK